MPELAFIVLGSNIQPEKHLPAALSQLVKLGTPLAVSKVYQSPAVGGDPQPDFLNAAVLLRVNLDPTEIRGRLRGIEAQLGRVRTADKYAPRTIDLDLAALGDQVIEAGEWRLPDPELTKQAHLAIPLAELAPDFPHPQTGETLWAIARRLRAQSKLLLRKGISQQMAELIPDQHSGASEDRAE